MATQNKIIEMIAAVKTIYSYYARETDVETLVKTWSMLLRSYDDEIVETAFYKCLQTCKMPPTPADVIEQINSMTQALAPTDTELWAVYEKILYETMKQVERFEYTFVDSSGVSQGKQARQKVEEIWQGLPEIIRRYVGTKGELVRLAREYGYTTDFCTYEKQRFLKAMPTMGKRVEYSQMMIGSGDNKRLLRGE